YSCPVLWGESEISLGMVEWRAKRQIRRKSQKPARKREAPLLDSVAAAIKKMLARGKERGYVTYDELNAALPPDQVSSEQIEGTMTMLSELGVNVIENEESEEPAAADAEDGDGDVRGNLDDDDVGRTDDPVRMDLREMG